MLSSARVNTTLAVNFINENGAQVEHARLEYTLHGIQPPAEIVDLFSSDQNPDGSWSPFWAPGYSSLDATCFHLAQAYQLGIDQQAPPWIKAILFVSERRNDDGTWEEDISIRESAPPWVEPGDQSAKLYLTSNCSYWLALNSALRDKVRKSAEYLAENLDETGRMPSFIQTHWLTAGVLHSTGMAKQTRLVMGYLQKRLDDFSASNLTWLITAIIAAEIPAGHALIQGALNRLTSMQQEDGSWHSDDGADFNLHTTLEALFALKMGVRI